MILWFLSWELSLYVQKESIVLKTITETILRITPPLLSYVGSYRQNYSSDMMDPWSPLLPRYFPRGPAGSRLWLKYSLSVRLSLRRDDHRHPSVHPSQMRWWIIQHLPPRDPWPWYRVTLLVVDLCWVDLNLDVPLLPNSVGPWVNGSSAELAG